MTDAPTTHRAPGFRVTRTDDATIFHRVPIFAECDRGDLVFGADWIADAVAAALQLERDGYLPPLHTRHHEPATDQTDAVRAVGVFRITGADVLTFKGKRVTAIFADLIVTDDAMAEDIAKMRYPYRSVEIFDPEGPAKINGLALLDHEAPYLELPMLFADEVDDKRDPNKLARDKSVGMIPDTGVGVADATSFSLNYSRKAGEPLLGSARRGNRASLLFRFPDEDDMTTSTKKANKAIKPKGANFADGEDDDKDGENMEGDEGGEGGLDVGSVVTAIESGAISVADMDAILAAIQSQSTVVEEEEEEAAPAPAPAPGAEIMKGGVNFAALQGQNEALKARLDARDAKDKRTTDVAGAMKRLEGKPLGADLEERLINFHEKADGNAELFKAYVDSMALSAGALPDDDSGENFRAQPSTPKSAMAFQAQGGEAVDKAAVFSREYQQMKGSGIRASEDAYVRVNMKQVHGIELEETAA